MTERPSQPPSRGDDAREALLRSAIAIFGEQGFAAASTRGIALAAGANPAMISYYFGGKQGLYEAAVQHIADQMGAHMGPVVARVLAAKAELDHAPPADAPVRYFDLLWSLVEALVTILASERSAPWARIILREQQQPSAAFEILYGGPMSRLLALATELIAAMDEGRRSPAEHRLTALGVLGQVLVYRAARAAVLRHMEWQRLGGAELQAVKTALRRNLRCMLEVDDG